MYTKHSRTYQYKHQQCTQNTAVQVFQYKHQQCTQNTAVPTNINTNNVHKTQPYLPILTPTMYTKHSLIYQYKHQQCTQNTALPTNINTNNVHKTQPYLPI